MRRRDLLALLPLGSLFVQELLTTIAAAEDQPFDAMTVRSLARELAQTHYKPPDSSLPAELKNLTYDQYRAIRFIPEHALWRGDHLPFELQLFHRGFFYSSRVDIFEVVQARARRVVYSPTMFAFGEVKPLDVNTDIGFAGFRLHYPLNRPDYFDEVAVFLGASYFRAVAKGQGYGLSARGLAINTADPKGEEFPQFRSFWVERPRPNSNSIVVHALLDSPSAAGAYRFTIRPGEETIFDVEPAIYPRVDLAESGIAPLTSMFLFDASNRKGVDDYRPAVHDSDGLAIQNGRDEHLWRPLANPTDLQISSFGDTNPRGFGLIQRQRDFASYQDLEAHYERRPSLWVEPIGDWGDGDVRLIEIPSKEEIHDNIVSFWRPRTPLAAKGEHTFTYRLHWMSRDPRPSPLAQIVRTRAGVGTDPNARLFVLDLVGDKLVAPPDQIRGVVWASAGKIDHIVTQPNLETGGWRLSFELAPEKQSIIELRAQLMKGDEAASEVWLYRWTP